MEPRRIIEQALPPFVVGSALAFCVAPVVGVVIHYPRIGFVAGFFTGFFAEAARRRAIKNGAVQAGVVSIGLAGLLYTAPFLTLLLVGLGALVLIAGGFVWSHQWWFPGPTPPERGEAIVNLCASMASITGPNGKKAQAVRELLNDHVPPDRRDECYEQYLQKRTAPPSPEQSIEVLKNTMIERGRRFFVQQLIGAALTDAPLNPETLQHLVSIADRLKVGGVVSENLRQAARAEQAERLTDEARDEPAVSEAVRRAYDTLGLKPGADAETIKEAYQRLARKYHPDRADEEKARQAEKAMTRINKAYQVLRQRSR